jgi:hypothetical protein
MRHGFLTSLILCIGVCGFSQGILKGKLSDSATKQTLSLATITVFKAKDTAIITYRLSDPQGEFRVPGLPMGILCRAVITFSGYRVYRKEFELSPSQPTLDLGVVNLVHDATSLDEVIVYAERPPVTVKKDTIEFNATAFKTLPTALVEDLLKKLPGVDVDKEGNITVNGRPVNRILVDGKDFFGGDPKVATRNLPADIIDKIQVVDDKEQSDKDPDIAKANLGQVINLKLKKAIKQGWFGKAYAGAGTDERYEAGAIINLFRDTLQASILGYSNNLNKPGFGAGDMMSLGGFQRTGVNSVMVMSDGGFSLNGISFGATGSGIQTSSGAGINVNNQLGKKVTLNLQYFFGHVNSKLGQISNTQQFFDDTTLTTRNITDQNSDDYNHRIGGRLKWKVDSLSDFTFIPSLNIQKNLSERTLNSRSFSNYEPALNESINLQNFKNESLGYSHEMFFNKNFRKKGRNLYLNNTLNTNSGSSDQFNDVENTFYEPNPFVTRLNQYRDRDQNTFRTSLQINYLEPITKTIGLRLTNTAEYFKDNDDLSTFNRSSNSGKYDSLNQVLSNGIRRSGFRNNASVGIRWTLKGLVITPAVNFQSLNIDNRFLKNPDIDQNFFYVLPSLNMNYKQWYLNYRVSAQEPNATDLQPVVDNSNPLYLQLGNPSLVPSITHNINVNFYKYDNKRLVNYNVYVNGSVQDDAVVRARTVDDKGVQITSPVNVDGIWRFQSSLGVNKQYKFNTSWQLSLRANIWATYNKSVVIVNNNRSSQTNFTMGPSAGWGFNYKDKFEFNQRYAVDWNNSRYDNPVYSDLEVITHYSTSEVVVRVPKNLVCESSVDYRYNSNAAPGIQKSYFRWNAGINYLFLKDQKGQLKFFVYDLLNQNINVNRTVRENYIQDNQITVLRRYFMLTFTYNIRNFKAGKVGGKDRFFNF